MALLLAPSTKGSWGAHGFSEEETVKGRGGHP